MEQREESILYNPRRAIEHLLKLSGYVPLRLFATLYPLWLIETLASQEKRRPYALIEHFIVRGIGEGDLHTTDELAAFLGLRRDLVEKVLIFLQTIQHVTCTAGQWKLTERGFRSLQAGEKSIPQQKTQILYFDGFGSRPLLREHYTKSLRLLSDEAADRATSYSRGGYQFQRLFARRPWNSRALSNLEAHPDRAMYNLPGDAHHLQEISVTTAYIPMYIVETQRSSAQSVSPYYLVYTHIKGRRDEFFEGLVNGSVEIRRALHAEQRAENVQTLWTNWLRSKGLAHLRPVRERNGLWRLVLPSQILRSAEGSFSVAEIGTYRIEQGYFLQIWCEDETVRRQAALDRTLKILQASQQALTREKIEDILQQMAEHLHIASPGFRDVYRQAREKNIDEIVEVLESVSGE